ncbi:MAG: galactose-1-phosphate uridylyltransferase [Candidatus Omnitrophota bacterium]|nr:MAG: galactose-1-phosphate uridylyltransferase [Candidatus Omnitrophota bacterium]
MPELRKNILTNEWVIIATERAKRPEDFQKEKTFISLQERVENCPFCPGNEKMTPPEVFAFREEGSLPDTPEWRVRVVPNKFPAQDLHEVIIETPFHHKTIATLSAEEMKEVILAYQNRFLSAQKKEEIKQITIFRNHGRSTGASKIHPHSQLIATPVLSQKFENQERIALSHWEKEKKCLYCQLLSQEKEKGERIILEKDRFIVFAPYASQSPFEIWIFPKRHYPCFADILPEEVEELSEVLPQILFKLYDRLDNPDYNYIIHSYLSHTPSPEAKHWFLQILPRLTPIGVMNWVPGFL